MLCHFHYSYLWRQEAITIFQMNIDVLSNDHCEPVSNISLNPIQQMGVRSNHTSGFSSFLIEIFFLSFSPDILSFHPIPAVVQTESCHWDKSRKVTGILEKKSKLTPAFEIAAKLCLYLGPTLNCYFASKWGEISIKAPPAKFLFPARENSEKTAAEWENCESQIFLWEGIYLRLKDDTSCVAMGDISVGGNRIQMIEGRLVLIEYRWPGSSSPFLVGANRIQMTRVKRQGPALPVTPHEESASPGKIQNSKSRNTKNTQIHHEMKKAWCQ